MAVAVVAASASMHQQDVLSSGSDGEPPQVELVRRKSRSRIGSQSSGEFEQELVAIPVRSTHVVADWQCAKCSKKLVLELKLSPNDEQKETEPSNIVPPTNWKNKLWLTMEVTDSTVPPFATMSRIVSGIGLLFILVSIINFVIETSPKVFFTTPHIFHSLGISAF
eukprot:TRINITY_DN2680_c0_g1_i2.p1 TRINITY_DN2680_c0_g1~~TRINITY_DN2680_c0_g1_i2.p1  ORF type:complete len:166 (+),score=26.08 TRINITY_DN2680_c0_g1_i2:82-579(+)